MGKLLAFECGALALIFGAMTAEPRVPQPGETEARFVRGVEAPPGEVRQRSHDAPARVGDLAWLTGTWESASGERWIEETWSAPRASMMIGFTRYGVGDVLHEFEFSRLQAGEDGVITYFAQPQGRPAVPFRLVRSEGAEAVFENPAHDYPQRIHYRRDGDTMMASISAIDGSHEMSWTFRRR